MQYVLALLMAATLGIGTYDSGKELMSLIVGMAQVATEKLTLNQIGKAITVENLSRGRKLTYRELPTFLKQNIGAGGRDASKDTWGTDYFMEIDKWRGLVFRKGGDEFVVCSAGPDKAWWNRDDELWYNFDMPENLLFRTSGAAGGTSEAVGALDKLLAFQKKTKEGLEKLAQAIGLSEGVTPTSASP